MIEIIMGVLSSSGFGALLGAINGYIQRYEERKNIALRFEHEQKMADLQISRDRILHEQGMESTELETNLMISKWNAKAEAEAFASSQDTKGERGELVKALVRPVVLIYLLTMTTIIALGLNAAVSGLEAYEEGEMIQLYKACVYMVLSLTSMGVSWYFAQRPSKHFDKMLTSITAKSR